MHKYRSDHIRFQDIYSCTLLENFYILISHKILKCNKCSFLSYENGVNTMWTFWSSPEFQLNKLQNTKSEELHSSNKNVPIFSTSNWYLNNVFHFSDETVGKNVFVFPLSCVEADEVIVKAEVHLYVRKLRKKHRDRVERAVSLVTYDINNLTSYKTHARESFPMPPRQEGL